ncbi:uncharacterized protein IL334_002380 [Kwoniella shivajii]|uniref:Uncharacterized protein n=1 Tax=Kwoniella shivajii TaxID=564305 RepID=A0ABZ1CUK7_9TREE|nr:hypothetical protein IL334_002380 [Kwoniella shivajii]
MFIKSTVLFAVMALTRATVATPVKRVDPATTINVWIPDRTRLVYSDDKTVAMGPKQRGKFEFFSDDFKNSNEQDHSIQSFSLDVFESDTYAVKWHYKVRSYNSIAQSTASYQ